MMKDRIKMIMESQQMSQQDFAKKLGISPASLSSIFTGRTNPTNNHVMAIHKAFPAINIEWLMFNEGSMLLPAHDSVSDVTVGQPETADGSDVQSKSAAVKNNREEETLLSDDLFSYITPDASKKPAPEVVTETKIIRRKVKEIRIFYDDGTYESFLPTKEE